MSALTRLKLLEVCVPRNARDWQHGEGHDDQMSKRERERERKSKKKKKIVGKKKKKEKKRKVLLPNTY